MCRNNPLEIAEFDVNRQAIKYAIKKFHSKFELNSYTRTYTVIPKIFALLILARLIFAVIYCSRFQNGRNS